jgi:hypothetical protein
VTVAASAIEGDGLYADDDVVAGTVLIRLAGRLVSSGELAGILGSADLGRPERGRPDPGRPDAGRPDPERPAPYVDTIAVDEDRHLVLAPGSIVHFGNHSCDPNMWHVGPFEIAARRDIRAGEELTVDYATHSAAAGFSMRCACGSSLCRGEVSSDDWRRPELQDRYRGHWVPVLADRIQSSRSPRADGGGQSPDHGA